VQRVAELLSGHPGSGGEKSTGLYSYYSSGSHRLTEKSRQIIRDFAMKSLPAAALATQTVYYPFGGPDVLYPALFFPNMRTLVLVAGEFVGQLPSGSEESIAGLRGYALTYIKQLLNLSFYQTKAMKEQQADKKLATLTKIVATLGMMGAKISSLEEITLSPTGEVLPLVRGNAKELAYAVRIKCVIPGSVMERTIYYFQQNLGASEYMTRPPLQDSPGFQAFVNNLDGGYTAFLKAASYKSHEKGFELSNELILRAHFIVQTDTGVPFRTFDENEWTVKFFGNYNGPTPRELFNYIPYEKDLAAAINASKGAKLAPATMHNFIDSYGGPLPFAYDYAGSRQVLIYAVKRPRLAPTR